MSQKRCNYVPHSDLKGYNIYLKERNMREWHKKSKINYIYIVTVGNMESNLKLIVLSKYMRVLYD